jgi:hypothetical protein
VSAAEVGGPDNELLVINARIVGNTEVGFLFRAGFHEEN